jgi:hypothetical protein
MHKTHQQQRLKSKNYENSYDIISSILLSKSHSFCLERTTGQNTSLHVYFFKKMRNTYNTLIEKPEEKRPFGRSGHRKKNNIKMNFT